MNENRAIGFIKPDTPRQVFFYEQDFYVLSNFSAFRVSWERIDFDTSEHAYHWEKFRCDTGWAVAMQIIDARSAHAAFKLAEQHKAQRRPDWDDIKVDVMRGILRAKASQHEYVRRKLLATGDRELIEDSWRDDFWGWGPHRTGHNMLGKLWMELRAELRAAAGAKASDQRQRFEAWADDQGFPLKRLETSDGYLDLRTHGAWEAYQRGAADGVNLPDGSKR
jgi:ribA/ribD-fused uncharacterized protein